MNYPKYAVGDEVIVKLTGYNRDAQVSVTAGHEATITAILAYGDKPNLTYSYGVAPKGGREIIVHEHDVAPKSRMYTSNPFQPGVVQWQD